MLSDYFPYEISSLSIAFGFLVGTIFAVCAAITKFCLRRSLVDGPDQSNAAAIWAVVLASAVLSTFILTEMNFFDLSDFRLNSPDIQWVSAIVGGSLFGVGMVLTRGCVSRLSILVGTGNLRAFFVLLIFAIVANMTLKGVFSPFRVFLQQFTLSLPSGQLSQLIGTELVLVSIVLLISVFTFIKSPISIPKTVVAIVIGLLVPFVWWLSAVGLQDEFDPSPLQPIGFTLPYADTEFWLTASTSISANFGVAFIGGVWLGGFAYALISRDFHWQSFENSRQTLRYLLGGVLMGIGAVIAGGCTIGNGLAGVSAQSIAAILTLLSIIFSGIISGKIIK